jgi:hypothetical protein
MYLADCSVGLVAVVLDLVAQRDQRVLLADDALHLCRVGVQALNADRGGADQQRHHESKRGA